MSAEKSRKSAGSLYILTPSVLLERKLPMKEMYALLKKAGLCFLATCEDGQPRVRPIDSVRLYGERLYFQTGRLKAVSRQLHANPRVELCTVPDGGSWLRIEGSAVLDDAPAVRSLMPETCPGCGGVGEVELWYLRKGAVTLYTPDEPPETHRF
jgi:uncharacterized pyridoxamine 5'-phosphate oxidase family protein